MITFTQFYNEAMREIESIENMINRYLELDDFITNDGKFMSELDVKQMELERRRVIRMLKVDFCHVCNLLGCKEEFKEDINWIIPHKFILKDKLNKAKESLSK